MGAAGCVVRDVALAVGALAGGLGFFLLNYLVDRLNNEEDDDGDDKEVDDGKAGELAKGFDMSEAVFGGFLDGINTSLKSELDIDSIEADTEIVLDIDFEKLYFNMHEAKADWLYGLKEWNNVLSEEKRREITKAWRVSKQFINTEAKVGPNDPCPCGSGKKFKKCCGRTAD